MNAEDEKLEDKVERLERNMERLELALLSGHGMPGASHRCDEALRALMQKHNVQREGGKKW